MKCTNCGNEIANGTQFCQVCGAPAPQPGPYQQQAPYAQQQGAYQQQGPYAQQQVSYQDAPLWAKIVSIFLPIVGLILWLVKRTNEPVAAKTCLVWAGVGIVINILWAFLF